MYGSRELCCGPREAAASRQVQRRFHRLIWGLRLQPVALVLYASELDRVFTPSKGGARASSEAMNGEQESLGS